MNNDDVKRYRIEKNAHSGLELEIHYMPDFFREGGCGAMPPHVHEFYQIIWFRRGQGRHHVDFVDYPVSDNTIFFIAPGQIHAFDGNTDFEGVIILFNASFMLEEETSENIFLKYNVFNAYDSLPYCKVTDDEATHLMNLVEEMDREYLLAREFAHRDYMQYLVRLFLIRAQRSGQRQEVPELDVSSIANRTFVHFRQLLEQNFHSVHTVQEYANLLNISSRTLTKYVGQSTYRSPLQIINDRIVLEAKRQLRHTPKTIKEIGYELGFEDSSYFVKFFKRLTGTMPGTFRSQG